jgi:hypothetical protein
MARYAKPKNIHPLVPKRYSERQVDKAGRYVRTDRVHYIPLPFGLGLVKYPLSWTKPWGGAYGLTGISIRTRFWALFDWADHATFDERGEYIVRNIRQRQNGKIRMK